MGTKQEAFNRALDKAVPGAVAALEDTKFAGQVAQLKADLAEAVAALNRLWEAPEMSDCPAPWEKREREEARAQAWAVIEKHYKP